MTRKSIIITILLILSLILLVASARAEVKDPVRNITNCVHGDSLDKDTCAKFDEPEKPKPKKTKAPQPVYVDFKGK